MTPTELPRVTELFERQVDRTPHAAAVSYGSESLSYAELEARANRLAHYLRAQGVGPDAIVAIAIERSLDMAVAVLAVLKAGGCYAPIDPAYPKQRLTFMMEDTRARVLLTTSTLAGELPSAGAKVVAVDTIRDELAAQPSARFADPASLDDLAYVIYTSGSTGTPKGVAMGRRPLVNLIVWQLANSQVRAGERTLQFAPLSFDVHFQEMFSTWSAGGELVLVDDSLRLDGGKLLSFLDEKRVARLFLPYIALQTLADVAEMQSLAPRALREIVTAGEALVVTRSLMRFFERMPDCTLHNHYGPSETHVVTAYTLEGAPSTWEGLPPIGKAIDGSAVYVLDEARKPVAEGTEGELFLGGIAVARGYLYRPELTDEKFVADPFLPGGRMYRTGDLARVRRDGNIEYLGRIDTQVKVRGYRIELGEIEVALASHPSVRQAVVVAREDDPGDKRLVAYVVPAGEPVPPTELRRHLAGKVPDYMMPSAFVTMTEMPRTPSGKIDRRGLPRPEGKRPELETSYVAPDGVLEDAIARLWARLIKIDRVGVNDNFFDLGGNSLLGLQTIAHLRQDRGIELPVVQLFAHPTVRDLVRYLEGSASEKRLATRMHRGRGQSAGSEPEAVAIIGMAGRFPGAAGIDELWDVLRSGKDTTTAFAAQELDPAVPDAQKNDAAYVRRRGIVADADRFDGPFFGMNPREAEITDPQQRLLLEIAWEALENSGYAPEAAKGKIGVFAGTHNNSYYTGNVLPRTDAVQRVGAFAAMVANEKDYVATRIAHKLNLTGPALSIHTACSTSLVAICVAVDNLLSGECDMALAGGAAVTVPQKSGHVYQEGGMLSKDGHTRSFDASAHGTTFGDGAALVVLKRLSDAKADGDTIHAVIRGGALNNDGATKVSFTAPSVEGQATVIALAQEAAGVDARSISYVEAHGTATPLGDPIEVEALTLAFREKTADTGFCGLGSVKSNFGHLTAAAGVTGVLKTVLALEHELIPGTVHFTTPNPNIDFAASPFYVVAAPTPWPRSATPRRAGVSSFGVGGTNAHVVLEEAPLAPAAHTSRPRQVLMLSARTAGALDAATAKLSTYLASHLETNLADAAFTLHAGRRAFSHRRFVVARDAKDAAAVLASKDPTRSGARETDRRDPPLVFLFPGQGAQYVGMGANLYRDEPGFRVIVDQCAEILLPHLGQDLRQVLYPADLKSEAASEILRRTEFTQPSLFVIEYALACLWMSWGVAPSIMVGHSVGEFVCAVLAGVMKLEDALGLVAARGRLIQSLPPGAMLSVRLPAADVQPRLSGDMAIASINGPKLCVVAGPHDAVAALATKLEGEGVVVKALHTSHAFHSPMMDPAVEPFAELVRKVTLSPPKIPFVSTVTAAPITPELATDPMYWARHLRQTVRFSEAVAEVWKDPSRVLLEVGPRTTLATLARQQITDKARQTSISSLGDTPDDDAEWTALLGAVGRLFLVGVRVDARLLYQHELRRRIPLPTYPFERQRYFLDPPAERPAAPALSSTTHPTNGQTVIHTDTVTSMNTSTAAPGAARKTSIIQKLKALFEDASGMDFADADPGTTFLELGLDSLFLTQIAMSMKREFGVVIGFRQLLEDLANLDLLSDHLIAVLPAEALPAMPAPIAAPAPVAMTAQVAAPQMHQVSVARAAAMPIGGSAPAGSVQALIEAQLRLMQQQLELLGGGTVMVAEPVAVAPALAPARAPSVAPAPKAAPPSNGASTSVVPVPGPSPYLEGDEPERVMKYDVKKAFGAIARITTTGGDELTDKQREALDAFTRRYTAKTKGSKAYAQKYRRVLADPRVVNGFRPGIKELIYNILCVRSAGSRIWDVDGNEYIDALNGFGSNFLGHASEKITTALKAQIDLGYEIGPMQPMVGEAAELFCELTGNERTAFCNTGSEAVMGVMRIARTVTGRSLIVIFSGSYHGIFDEVIVRGTRKLRSVPAAPGILPEAVENVLVLDYGTPESMAIIKERANELAAVMVEPVQSRRPDFQPVEFLRELRTVTEQAGCAFIFDEVITGLRLGPGGAQAHFGVKADLATYGKAPGGGMPFGVMSGKAAWMDALDGGQWQFGDDSKPEVGVTYFAGTFVRHPLAMAACKATLQYLKEAGPSLQQGMNARTERLAKTLNAHFADVGAPVKIKHFGSLWKTFQLEDHPMQDLLFCYMREKGIHIWDGFPCFLSAAHTDADVDAIIDAFKASLAEMQEIGFYPKPARAAQVPQALDASKPPVPGARLGRDPNGNPAWFVPNPSEQGKYMKVETS
ncbi:MAG TPA: amino acid adenylation domain-containing protein [Polyangiaceae bacterium]|nr:amino acid adenylation domain-containing protein [Polyangiaceae bacterium]